MDWFRRMMMGRYGTDQLCVAFAVLYVLLSLIAQLFRLPILLLIAYIPLALCFYRMFSRNIGKRYQENVRFLKWWSPVHERLRRSLYRAQNGMHHLSYRMKDRKTHRYYKCPHCSNTLRVPKGKGKISITCPVCRTEFIKKT
ncbi:hypothetical protein [Caproiciproducens faecalis]|uniref:Zn-finger containing protein n=1 Tax=Caproiciproducens faecalis TaxID=2820301 RepID=A0ABS7DMW5_9FIRM|nr:hypothetical protein [Caproiciproducens faecalis]MBW7572622.1 hypothetical protein [Caproiciproducens faecalis]